MKRVFCGLLLTVFLFSFVIAGSEISANFIITEAESHVDSYIPTGNFWNDYGGYVVVVLVILIFGYFGFKVGNKAVSRREKVKKTLRKIVKMKR